MPMYVSRKEKGRAARVLYDWMQEEEEISCWVTSELAWKEGRDVCAMNEDGRKRCAKKEDDYEER